MLFFQDQKWMLFFFSNQESKPKLMLFFFSNWNHGNTCKLLQLISLFFEIEMKKHTNQFYLAIRQAKKGKRVGEWESFKYAYSKDTLLSKTQKWNFALNDDTWSNAQIK